MFFRREAHVYVGVDVHKGINVAVMVNAFGEAMGKPMKFDNSPAAFELWHQQVEKRAGGLGVSSGWRMCMVWGGGWLPICWLPAVP